MLFIKCPGRALLLLGDVGNGRGIGRRKLLSEKLGLPLSGLEVGWGFVSRVDKPNQRHRSLPTTMSERGKVKHCRWWVTINRRYALTYRVGRELVARV